VTVGQTVGTDQTNATATFADPVSLDVTVVVLMTGDAAMADQTVGMVQMKGVAEINRPASLVSSGVPMTLVA